MTECPITSQELFSALIEGKFSPFTKQDEMSFAGVEYSGYTWTPFWKGCNFENGEVIVVLDHGPGGMHFNVIRASLDGDNQTWAVHMNTPEFKQIEG